MIGRMHTGTTTHAGRLVKTTQDGIKLYAPLCASMSRAIAYLGKTADTEVTCKRCQGRIAKHPHLVTQ